LHREKVQYAINMQSEAPKALPVAPASQEQAGAAVVEVKPVEAKVEVKEAKKAE
jgi:hypothetical protein